MPDTAAGGTQSLHLLPAGLAALSFMAKAFQVRVGRPAGYKEGGGYLPVCMTCVPGCNLQFCRLCVGRPMIHGYKDVKRWRLPIGMSRQMPPQHFWRTGGRQLCVHSVCSSAW